jgi:hypothetical protein
MGFSAMDAMRALFGGSSGDSDMAEYNRLNDRCVSKGDYDTCQKRNNVRDRLRMNGIAVQ